MRSSSDVSGSWFQAYAADLFALVFNLFAMGGYHVFQLRRARKDPDATIQSHQTRARADWVAEVLRTNNGILGVQTLRNAMMGTVFLASNTMFSVFGVLSLSAQQHLGDFWGGALDAVSAQQGATLLRAKLLLLLLALAIAFFCFLSAIRLFSHASVSVGTKTSSPEVVTEQLNTAWRYQTIGLRCYYFAAPVLFWLFGALAFALSTIGSVVLMHRFDSGPARGRR